MTLGTPADVERQVTDVARALHKRGSTSVGVTLLRGALRRDEGQDPTRRLLAELTGDASQNVQGSSTVVELDLGLVDGWIRRGMLVEALSLLGGTSLGSRELGREWANLLGELLAPVPVEAEAAFVDMYEQLLSGGASVALSLLEERNKQEPQMPAWAFRRLELLRWMLLDNAEVAHSHYDGNHHSPSELAGVLEVLERRGLSVGHSAVKAFVELHPDHADAARTLRALDTIVGDLDRQANLIGKKNKTMPMVGHTAALMQLRMGNLAPAAKLYETMVETTGDVRASALLSEVQVLLRVLDGRSAAPSVRPSAVELYPDDEPTVSEPGMTKETPSDWPIAETNQHDLPFVTELSAPDGVDIAPTTQQPAADYRAEQLVAEGRLEEAEELYNGLLDIAPDRDEWKRRVAEVRSMRLSQSTPQTEPVPDDVLVRIILPVK